MDTPWDTDGTNSFSFMSKDHTDIKDKPFFFLNSKCRSM